MPNGTVILYHYKEYMENHELVDSHRQMLFCFFHEIGLCEFDVERKIFEGQNNFESGHNIR